MGKKGCCYDGCTTETCMNLPEGKTCGDCAHGPRCFAMFGHQAVYTYCDWFPRKFKDRTP